MSARPLAGTTVLIAGAGLAGLAAARVIEQRGGIPLVIEARDRVGGRVWTIRDGFEAGQHAEAGADLIEADHTAVLDLIRDLGLRKRRILRGGFGYYGLTPTGRVGIQSLAVTFAKIDELLDPLIREYRLSEQRWDTAIAAALARESVAAWLDRVGADRWIRHRFVGLRGLFLADPGQLSLLALVDFFATEGQPRSRMYRLLQGNDTLATELARRLGTPPELRTILRRVRQDVGGVTATVERAGSLAERRADFLISTLPATTLREVTFDPPLPDEQRRAIDRLKYGAASRLLLQFDRRFWSRVGQPAAFGTDQPFGALWDGNEQQRGPAILSVLAGGAASRALHELIGRHGQADLLSRLRWLGRPARVLASHMIRWDADPWCRGGYAYFDPAFDPRWRDRLAQPFARVLFAGEHTSIRWQGYINGAVETGQRAAAEVEAMTRQRSGGFEI